jgi:hypothetical protein
MRQLGHVSLVTGGRGGGGEWWQGGGGRDMVRV